MPSIEISPFTCYPTPIARIFGEVRFHTDGELVALQFAADGKLWSVEEPGKVRQWNPASGQLLLSHYLSDTETLWTFGAGGQLLASASDELSLWDSATGRLLVAVSQPSWVTALAFSRDGRFLVTGHDDGTARVWDTSGPRQADGQPLALIRECANHRSPISDLAVSPDGKRLASAGEDRTITLWDLGTGKAAGTFNGHTDRIQELAWHPNGRILVSAGWDTTARLWDAETFQPILLLNGHADQVTALTFNEDGSLLACADSENAIHVWEPLSGRELGLLREHEDEIRCLAFTRDGSRLASAGADRVIKLWDPRQSTQQVSRSSMTLSLHASVAVSRDNTQLASTVAGVGLQIWEIASGRELRSLPESGVIQVVAWSPDGRWLAGGGTDHHVRIWDISHAMMPRILERQKGRVSALAFSPDSRLLASASVSDGTVWLWTVDSGEPCLVIPEAADNCVVKSLAFHPDGNVLAAGGIDWLSTSGSDGAVRLWNVNEPGPIFTFDGGTGCLAFHPTGRLLAGGSLRDSILVWDLDSRSLLYELTDHAAPVTTIAYSPDGRWLVSGSNDRTIRFWNAVTGESAAAFGFDTQIKALCFSADGRFLFTSNGNTTCYQLDVEQLLAEE